MKTIAITTIFLLSIHLGKAQQPIIKEVGDFNIIKVFDLIETELIKGDEQKVEVSGRNADKVRVINKDGKLKIRMEINKRFKGEDVFVKVYYKSLDVIDGNEGSRITLQQLIKQDEIELRTQEGAKISGGFEVDHIDIRVVTGGIIETTGKAQSQDVKVNTGGIYKGRALETERTEVFVQAGGEVSVHTTKKVSAKVRAGGEVYVYGNPTEVNKNTVFGGNIKVY